MNGLKFVRPKRGGSPVADCSVGQSITPKMVAGMIAVFMLENRTITRQAIDAALVVVAAQSGRNGLDTIAHRSVRPGAWAKATELYPEFASESALQAVGAA